MTDENGEWKVQFSRKNSSGDMWNFRGPNVYEVKKMIEDAFGKKAEAPLQELAASGESEKALAEQGMTNTEAPTMTPLEKARARMAAQKEG